MICRGPDRCSLVRWGLQIWPQLSHDCHHWHILSGIFSHTGNPQWGTGMCSWNKDFLGLLVKSGKYTEKLLTSSFFKNKLWEKENHSHTPYSRTLQLVSSEARIKPLTFRSLEQLLYYLDYSPPEKIWFPIKTLMKHHQSGLKYKIRKSFVLTYLSIIKRSKRKQLFQN